MDPTLYLAAGNPRARDPEDFYAEHGHAAFALWSGALRWLRRARVRRAAKLVFADPALNV